MKFKKIIIITFLLLTVLTVGAVSASEDITSDDNLTVETGNDDSIQEIDDSDLEENIASPQSNDEIVGADYDPSKIECDIYTDISLDDDDGVVVFTSTDPQATGDLIIYIENAQRLKKTIQYSDYNPDENGNLICKINIKPHELQINSEGRFDNWKVTFNGQSIAEEEQVFILPYTFYFEDEWGNDLDDGYYGYGETMNLYVYIPSDATARLTVTINKKTYEVTNIKKGVGIIPINTKGWALGEYKVTAKYYGDNKYLQRVIEDSLYIRPNVECPEIMAYGETEQIKVSAPSGLSGEVNLKVSVLDELNNIYKQTIDTDLTFKNGVATYSLSRLAAGDYIFEIYYKIGSYERTLEFETEIIKNTAGISSSISPTTITQGQQVTVKITGPQLDAAQVDIYINDKIYKSTLFKTGQITEILTDLPVGDNKINVFMNYEENGETYFHSNTKHVTVNAKSTPASTSTSTSSSPVAVKKITLSLNKVSVSKSKKKIVLTATLKINGVAKKGQKITFKFNGKKYSAKTNAKGVSKVTIKKSVLKKLKVGKKIKYTATFDKKTVSKTVKVKK